ncbi:MAG: hypothetical protein GY903_11955 [Fuerstiella sp.]|nr:hypothetical protein [Fuerstiella sp.]MCP4855196.1 hypothetical protein [Fuerstiella sp.]
MRQFCLTVGLCALLASAGMVVPGEQQDSRTRVKSAEVEPLKFVYGKRVTAIQPATGRMNFPATTNWFIARIDHVLEIDDPPSISMVNDVVSGRMWPVGKSVKDTPPQGFEMRYDDNEFDVLYDGIKGETWIYIGLTPEEKLFEIYFNAANPTKANTDRKKAD